MQGWTPPRYASDFLLFSHSVVSDSLQPPWTAARQAPLSAGFSRQDTAVASMAPPADLAHPAIELESPMAPASPANSLPPSHQGNPALQITVRIFLFPS